ncbi:MAG: bifunctional methylenetetrahydrofolate dehydrogenase/methenyltetrahydrofolate cyclohydrolase FolD [Nitrospirae bacterium]|nr:MAG: bifunctional methylenetetrahydrofolate dehydrogenase/methenyltetrahydrofolate cyclohydrolase FolD [Nitrospirota bacterium]
MAAHIFDGKALAQRIRVDIEKDVAILYEKTGVRPGLAAILVGDDPASAIYVRNKKMACDKAGLVAHEHRLSANTTQEELLALIQKINADPAIHGILVQLPLPPHIDNRVVLEAIAPHKDVDGFHPYNMGRLVEGDPVFVPCTPKGIMAMLDAIESSIEGAQAVVLGRSTIVGKPMALLLLHRHATVTICHSRTRDLSSVCRQADIVIAAIGKPHFITAEMIKKGAIVIDVGINRLDDGALVGDVDFESVKTQAGWLSPVPGGVGPMTIAMLLQNTLESAQRAVGWR